MVLLTDFVLKKDENYYPQVFLRECKYIEKEKKAIKYITDDLRLSSDESDLNFLLMNLMNLIKNESKLRIKMGSLRKFICVKLLSLKREGCTQQMCVLYFFKTMFIYKHDFSTSICFNK